MDYLGEFLSAVGLYCPDDRTPLIPERAHLACNTCQRSFPIYEGRIIELLPKQACTVQPPVSTGYLDDYERELQRPFAIDSDAIAWGSPESINRRQARKRQRQVAWCREILTEGSDAASMTVADLSAGAGWHTIPLSARFRFVLHCDLSVDSLNHAYRMAREQKVANIMFLRIDYLSPPFLGNLDRAICLDTLIRGQGHDRQLLDQIVSCVSSDGFALVDLHNWWHNPLRRIGLLPNNFGDNRSYSRREVERMLRLLAADAVSEPFYGEIDASSPFGHVLSKMLPATHLGYRLRPHKVSWRAGEDAPLPPRIGGRARG